jgi:hypothetical protein
MYESLSFANETVDGPKMYLEWRRQAFGKDGGTTILTCNDMGLIQSMRLYHRPLHTVMEFSAELGGRLEGKIDPNLFYTGNLHQEPSILTTGASQKS